VAGIEIRVHSSFLVLVALFAVAAPEPGLTSVLISELWLVAIFACVVAHELAHCFVARRSEARVDEILLLPLGGISRLRNLPDDPDDELAIAIAGPLTSIGLGLAALAVSFGTGGGLAPSALLSTDWVARFAWLNLLLGTFNLLPAFPLDGGRVYRAWLERRYDLETATRRATRVGHALAAALIVGGILFDVWIALIGLFVYFGASAEQAATIVHARLKGHRVREVVTLDAEPGADQHAGTAVDEVQDEVQVDIDAPLDDDVLEALFTDPRHEIAVSDHGRVRGHLKGEDVMRLVGDPTAEPPQ
jgi:Zn-dependent protease